MQDKKIKDKTIWIEVHSLPAEIKAMDFIRLQGHKFIKKSIWEKTRSEIQ